MQRFSTFALLATVALACVAHAAAQAAATTATPLAEAEAPAPSAQRTTAFLAANITAADALVTRVESGADNTTGQLTCQFILVGAGLSTPVDVTSLDPSTQATALESAVITCTGSTSNATIQGGPALADFTSNFSGSHKPTLTGCASDHSLQTHLPEATHAVGCT